MGHGRMLIGWMFILCVTFQTDLTLSHNAINVGNILRPNRYFCCSVDPYYASEDIKTQMKSLQESLQTLISYQVKTDSKCPVRYGASCYYFVKERVTWQTALERCKIGGAQLVSIETAGENVFLQNYIRSRPDLNTKPANVRYLGYWTSATDQAQEGRWVWASNKKVASYFNWGPVEPNGGRRHNCVHIWKGIGWKWNDLSCVDRYGYICEIPNGAL